jgi:hypothetical protein
MKHRIPWVLGKELLELLNSAVVGHAFFPEDDLALLGKAEGIRSSVLSNRVIGCTRVSKFLQQLTEATRRYRTRNLVAGHPCANPAQHAADANSHLTMCNTPNATVGVVLGHGRKGSVGRLHPKDTSRTLYPITTLWFL